VCVYILILVIRQEKLMRSIISSFVICLAVTYLAYYLINCTIFGKIIIGHKTCVLIFSINLAYYLINCTIFGKIIVEHKTCVLIFSINLAQYLINYKISRKIIIGHKTCVLIFSTNFFLNISRFKNNSARYYHKCTYFFMLSTRYSCIILMNLNFPNIFSNNKHLIS